MARSTERATTDGALFDHFRVIGRYRRWVGAIALLGALFGYVTEARKPDTFAATSTVRFVVPEAATSGTSAKDSAELLSQSYARAATSPAFADRVRAKVGGTATVRSIQRRLKIAVTIVPGFLDLTATATTGKDAAGLADTAATELAAFIRSEQDGVVTAALAPLRAQLADVDTALTAATLDDTARGQLVDQRGQLSRFIAEREQQLRYSVITPEPAAVPRTRTGPNPTKNAITMALLATIVATEGFVLFRFVRGLLPLGDPAGELGRIVDAPVLEVGPVRRRRSAGAVLPFVLQHFGDHPVITVVQRDGDPTSLPASMIADALARSGHRVLLVDADTRSPRLHEELEVPLSPGLVEVVAGDERLSDAVRPSPTGSGVVVLSAGAAAEPAARANVANGGLETLVRHAGAEVNVVATSSSTSIEDALLVVHQFPDAVVLAVDARSARRSDLVETVRIVRSIGGNVVGALCVHTAPPTWRQSLQRLRQLAA